MFFLGYPEVCGFSNILAIPILHCCNYSPARPKVDIPDHFPGVIGAVSTGCYRCYRGWKPLLRYQGKVGAASSRDCSEAEAPHGTKVVTSYKTIRWLSKNFVL